MAVMLYALVIYQMRARSIRLRTGAPYDDRLGPVSGVSPTSFHERPFEAHMIRWSAADFGYDIDDPLRRLVG